MNTISRIKKIIRDSVHLLYINLIEPKSLEVKNRRKEFILNIILNGLIGISLFLGIELIYSSIQPGSEYKGFSVLTFTGIFLFFVLLLIVSRYGHIKLTAYTLIVFCLCITTYCQYTWGTSLPSSLLGDALIITMSTVLIGRIFGILISLSIGVKLILLSHLEAQKEIIALWKTLPITINTGVQLALILFTTTILSWIYSREIENSLTQALQSEKKLQEKNESLELIIEERTKALRLAEIDKNAQLYRFVEFGKLSAGVFHDILNPLTVVSLNIESLRSSLNDATLEVEDSISRAIQASKRMEKFILGMRKQIQTLESLSMFSVHEEIEEVLLLFSHKACKNHVQLFFTESHEIKFFGNPLKFHQIIANIISNAIDSYQNSLVENSPRVVYINTKKKQNYLILTIKDRGVGIPENVLKNIFEPFFTTKEKLGIGIGLSSTKHIIEKNFNGTIRVKSQHQVGTIFTITLPFSNPDESNNAVTQTT